MALFDRKQRMLTPSQLRSKAAEYAELAKTAIGEAAAK
jgi:hypothetical protein